MWLYIIGVILAFFIICLMYDDEIFTWGLIITITIFSLGSWLTILVIIGIFLSLCTIDFFMWAFNLKYIKRIRNLEFWNKEVFKRK